MRLLIFSNVFIAVAATLFTRETYYLLGVEPQWSPLLVLVFLATLVVYNLDRLSGAAEEDAVEATARHRWIEGRQRVLWSVTAAAGLGCVATLPFLPMRVILALVPLAVVSLAYSLPVIWGKSGPYRLKDIAGLKIFLISFVWAGATAFLPAARALESPWNQQVGWVVLERAIFIFAITLPFDIRDMKRDRASDIKTVPLLIGVGPTRWLAVALMGIFAALALWNYGWGWEGPGPALLVSAVLTAGILTQAGPQRGEFYHVGLLDGMMAVQWLLVASF